MENAPVIFVVFFSFSLYARKDNAISFLIISMEWEADGAARAFSALGLLTLIPKERP